MTDRRRSNAPFDALPAFHRMPRVGEALTVDDEELEKRSQW